MVAVPERLLPCSPHDREVSSGNSSPRLSPLLSFVAWLLMVLLLVCDQYSVTFETSYCCFFSHFISSVLYFTVGILAVVLGSFNSIL